MCRSLTYAQRAVRVLEREGIRAGITRAPQGLSPEGCSYAVRLAEKQLQRAVRSLKSSAIPLGRIYRIGEDGPAEVKV